MPKRQARVRFTDAYLQKLKVPEDKREFIQFESNTGLGVRASATGNISFIVQTRLKDGRRWRETLGAYGALTIASARSIAQERSADAKRGGQDGDLFKKHADAIAEARLSADARKFTLRALIERWKRDHLSQKRHDYAVRAFSYIERRFGGLLDRPAASLTKAEVRETLEATRDECGVGSARNSATSLRAAFRWALSEDLLASDPLSGFKLPPRVEDRERVLTIGEARRIYRAAASLPYPAGTFVQLLMLTGCRRSEIAGLRWDEIADEADGKAIVLSGARTKTGSGHHVPLSAKAVDVIADARHRIVGSKFVFTSDGWRPFSNFSRLKGWLDAAIGEDGDPVEDWRLHDFRRTLVSTLAAKPFRYDPVTLDLLLGHQPSQLSPVARIYQKEKHLDVRRAALEAWGEHLSAPPAEVVTLPAPESPCKAAGAMRARRKR
jgi:integrase